MMRGALRNLRSRRGRAVLRPQGGSLALLGERAGLEGRRVMVLGPHPEVTLSCLKHTECHRAVACLPDAVPEAQSADLVLVPCAEFSTIRRVIDQACWSLDPFGRVVIAAPRHERDFVNVAIEALVRAGFDAPCLQNDGSQTRIYAERGPDAATSVLQRS